MNLTEIKEYILLQGSESTTVCGGNFEGGIYLQQYPDEIAEVLDYLLKARASYSNMLEVGSAAGGNSKVFSEILSINKLYIVDDNNHPRHQYRPTTLKGLDYIEYIGNSQSKEAKDWVASLNTKFDIVYIDADHSFDGLYRDMQNFVEFVKEDGYVILHDTLVCEGVVRAAARAGDFRLKEIFSSKHKLGITLFQLL